jgi:hypothetical protein
MISLPGEIWPEVHIFINSEPRNINKIIDRNPNANTTRRFLKRFCLAFSISPLEIKEAVCAQTGWTAALISIIGREEIFITIEYSAI